MIVVARLVLNNNSIMNRLARIMNFLFQRLRCVNRCTHSTTVNSLPNKYLIKFNPLEKVQQASI